MHMNHALWSIIAQTDLISKLVLFVMLVISVICWSLGLYKVFIFKTKTAQLKKALALLENVNTLDDFITRAASINDTYGGDIIAHYLTDFKMALKSYHGSYRALAEKDWQLLQSNMMQTLEDAISKEESLLSVLQTSAQAGPLLGLFGTVWGLIHAFLGISASGNADISSVAPGIAEALITTLAGLVVAIPALMMYNFLQNKVRVLEHHIIALMDKSYWIMRSLSFKAESVSQDNPTVVIPRDQPAQRDVL